ncbi:STAS domain-containing protein [Jannaschia donghaensis]|uniref:STAS domain-containing protein n=1 Tax=Jannaschia donghaensis TaxID=420998 RepID=A0A0M6YLG0_9RHOB|nr:STAS domain-containing protein [Jannaschia donghaensis]CTQ50669.1 hypothetical protein JDO7802_02695 [Jannaschia donghaensis]
MTDLSETDGTIVLPERMDIGVAVALRDMVLSKTRDLILDASGVNVVMTSALQVLMAACDHQRSNDKTLAIANASRGFMASLKTLGVPFERLHTAEKTS